MMFIRVRLRPSLCNFGFITTVLLGLTVGFSAHSLPTLEGPTPVMAPIDWGKWAPRVSTSPDLNPSPQDLRSILKDPDGRVSDLFSVPRGLRPATLFWLRIYTKYTSDQIVLHDKSHPEIVYEVLDFSELKENSRSHGRFAFQKRRRIRKALREYRLAFQSLIENPEQLAQGRRLRGKKGKIARALARRIGWSRLKDNPTYDGHDLRHFQKSLRGQTGQRDFILAGLQNYDRFLPEMEKIFEERGLPTELIAITLVESSFNTEAVSKAGAVGVWQFMKPTGREFMKVVDPARGPTRGIDERKSPLKSTIAATQLLKRNFRIFRDWPLAITAYNSGPRPLLRVSRSLRLQTGRIFHTCRGARTLGRAGRNYYSEFLAILHATRYRDLFYGEYEANPLPRVEFVQTDQAATPSELAEQLWRERGVSIVMFRELNPELRNSKRRLPKGYTVVVPVMDGREGQQASLESVRENAVIGSAI